MLSITLAVAVGVAVPVFLYGLTQWQRLREQTLAEAMLRALDGVSGQLELQGPLSELRSPHRGVRRPALERLRRLGATAAAGCCSPTGGGTSSRSSGTTAGGSRAGTASTRSSPTSDRPACCPMGTGSCSWRSRRSSDYGRELVAAAKPAAIVAGGALAIALALAAMLARSIVAPIERLRAAAVQMANGDLAVEPVALVRGDEVAALAGAFDRMAARVRADEADLRRGIRSSSSGPRRSWSSTSGSRRSAGSCPAWPTS